MTPTDPPTAAPQPLPPLRQELELLRDNSTDGYKLYDPVRGRYHSLSREAVQILGHWESIPVEQFLSNLQAKGVEVTQDETEQLTEFLLEQKLTTLSPGQSAERLADQEAVTRRPWHEQLIHKYLFFRIPLWQPQTFLDRWTGAVSPILRKETAWMILIIGMVGLFFAARQWDQFLTTFLYFFTFKGFVFYALSLIIIKILHELGHAFVARHFGVRVPVIGVAFLVMFPVLYTDTTDAWRLQDRRARMWIGAAGMIVELSIAAISLFLWAFLPDGLLRSLAFFAATTSWVMSLFVNLNPWMRFDGYYLLSDQIRVPNLQQRGFDVGRYVMRRTLFGLVPDSVEPMTTRRRIGLCIYAWTTWIYRFFLFIGIAILVHHIFPKAIGIILFVIEIGMFIALPIWREIKYLWSQKMPILASPRGRMTLSLTAAALIGFVYPWPARISAPALMQPAHATPIYAASAGELTTMEVRVGDRVKSGDIIAQLDSPDLRHKRKLAQEELRLAQARWARQAADATERAQRSVVADILREKEDALRAVEAEIKALDVKAPHDGIISDVPDTLHIGRTLPASFQLARINRPGEMKLTALPRDSSARRLSAGNPVLFIPDEPGAAQRRGVIEHLSPTALDQLDVPALSSLSGGPVGVTENDKGQAVPDIPIFRVETSLDGPMQFREARGTVWIDAQPKSLATTLWTHVAGVLLRETDF